jgi:hypothetical protein
MNRPAAAKRFPAWLRFLGWLAFSGLALVTVLVVARWWIPKIGHQRAMKLVKHSQRFPHVPKHRRMAGEAVSSTRSESGTQRGTPVAEVPLVSVMLGGDTPARKALQEALTEMEEFLKNAMLRESRIDGVLSFRALLTKMGVIVPESMTEGEAAAAFLKHAERFSGLLAQWREAVGKGPWDCSTGDINVGMQIGRLPQYFQKLLGTMAEAHLRLGDSASAWSGWKTMELSAERCGDSPMMINGIFEAQIRRRMFETARAGMALNAWTDDQLAEISASPGQQNSLDAMCRDIEGEKKVITDFFAHLRDNRTEIVSSLQGSGSVVQSVVNWIGVSLTSDQQIEDNLAVIHHKMEQPLSRFDPDTGILLASSAGENGDVFNPENSSMWFDDFYMMYSKMYGDWRFYDSVPQNIIKNQSAIDQSRLAAALEIHHRATGEYPESLDAVSATFSGTMPRDIATGQPYLYQRDANGGYKLWGTGIDGKSDGGNDDTDVIWTHRPVKTK